VYESLILPGDKATPYSDPQVHLHIEIGLLVCHSSRL